MDESANLSKVHGRDRQSNVAYFVEQELAKLAPEMHLLRGDELQGVWENLRYEKALVPLDSDEYKAQWVQLMLARDTVAFLAELGGLVYYHDILPGRHAFFEGAIWNKKLYGRQDLTHRTLQFMFNVYNLNRIGAVVIASFPLAAKYLESLGFKHEGTSREFMPVGDGTFVDMWHYGLLRKEYENASGSSSRRSGSRSGVLGDVGTDDTVAGSVATQRREGIVKGSEPAKHSCNGLDPERRAKRVGGADKWSGSADDSGDARLPRSAWSRWKQSVFRAIGDWASKRAD